ncbi:hypothetical protein QQX98_002271 [Neonectria punicea]|uniref:Apple domain-containing protein n=1 Tax=Neonectria punicea TaxID=979145 RepID=A0ABR1HJP5_9HYPO
MSVSKISLAVYLAAFAFGRINAGRCGPNISDSVTTTITTEATTETTPETTTTTASISVPSTISCKAKTSYPGDKTCGAIAASRSTISLGTGDGSSLINCATSCAKAGCVAFDFQAIYSYCDLFGDYNGVAYDEDDFPAVYQIGCFDCGYSDGH